MASLNGGCFGTSKPTIPIVSPSPYMLPLVLSGTLRGLWKSTTTNQGITWVGRGEGFLENTTGIYRNPLGRPAPPHVAGALLGILENSLQVSAPLGALAALCTQVLDPFSSGPALGFMHTACQVFIPDLSLAGQRAPGGRQGQPQGGRHLPPRSLATQHQPPGSRLDPEFRMWTQRRITSPHPLRDGKA